MRARFITGLLVLAGTLSAPLSAADENAVNALLDRFHERAAMADFDGYFALYHDQAVFVGTDPDEHWTLAEFQAYAKPHFDKGVGWTYVPTERHVHRVGDTAWFEESLRHERYGETRGTGVLLLTADGWRVAQYHLTVPIPNAMLPEIAAQIAAGDEECCDAPARKRRASR